MREQGHLRGGAGKLLTRHPKPLLRVESLHGYVLRLTDCNGYSSPWRIHQRAGLSQHEVRGTRFNIDKLSLIAACTVDELNAIAYSSKGSPHSPRLLGVRINPGDLDLTTPRICPVCIQQLGYIQAHWDLQFMIGCPIHNCHSLRACSTCNRPISWYRPGLLVCQCGSALDLKSASELDWSTRALLELIRDRVLGMLRFVDDQAHFPDGLYDLQLINLLAVIRCVGECEIQTSGTGVANPLDTVESAARVFSNWPENFFRLLARLHSRPAPVPYDIRRHFAPLYNSLLKRRTRPEDSSFRFFRIAFLDFVSNHQSLRACDPRLMSQIRSDLEIRYNTRAGFARKLRVDPRTVTRHISPTPNNDRRPPFSVVVDTAGFEQSTIKPFRILSSREAAAELMCPVSLLALLKSSGIFASRHRLLGQVGYHDSDVLLVKNRILDSADSARGSDAGECIALVTLLRKGRYSLESRLNLVSALLSKELEAFLQGPDRLLTNIMVPRREVERAMSAHKEASGLVNASDAAGILQCDNSAVAVLVRLGQLAGSKTGSTWRIRTASVRQFTQSYSRLSKLAQEVGTSTRCLARVAAQIGIATLSPFKSANDRDSFVPRADESRLLSHFHRLRVETKSGSN